MLEALTEYLNALDPSGLSRFCIETYTDAPKGSEKPVPDPLQGRWSNLTHMDVLELYPELKSRNDAGAGIFVAINEFNGHRSKANLQRVRCVHADVDSNAKSFVERVSTVAPPTMIVKSSRGNAHCYWCIDDDMNQSTAEQINRALVRDYGADKAAVDVTRLLRIPGFMHMKHRADGEAPLVILLKVEGPRYIKEQLITAFKPASSESFKHSMSDAICVIDSGLIARIEEAVRRRAPDLWAGHWSTTV